MKNLHFFKSKLNWIFSEKSSENPKRHFVKNHQIVIEGKEILNLSAAKSFKGDPTLLNPEDLLLSSLTSCHMMSYLYCCSINNINVISYTDNSEAILEVNQDGSGQITKVTLNPKVVITKNSDSNLAKELHQKANELCFIANSCKFPVEHFPLISVENQI